MANEFSITCGVMLKNGNNQFVSQGQQYKASQSTNNGPSPGAIKATTSGLNVSLAELTLPGVTLLTNTDATNYVTYGLYDGTTFRPFGELLPGESALFRLSRSVLTANAAADVVRFVANTATVVVLVNCFDT